MIKTFILAIMAMSLAAEDVKPQPPEFKDGITKEEWLKQAAARFDAMDVNKDGKISKEEMGEFRKKGGEGPGRHKRGEGPDKGPGEGPKKF